MAPTTALMRDRTLTTLVLVATTLSVGHDIDHVIRGDLSLPFIMILLVIYAPIALGLYLYSTHRVGPGFWAILAGVGVVFGWVGHFSPFTDQPPRHILAAYESAVAGWLALSCLLALMLVLLVAAVYATCRWASRAGLHHAS